MSLICEIAKPFRDGNRRATALSFQFHDSAEGGIYRAGLGQSEYPQ
jgi:hypothetical protein